MPKNAVSDWDTTANNNTDVGGINIAEGCAMANLNNGMREIMAQVKAADFLTSDDDLTAIATNGLSAFSGLLYGLTLSNNSTDATNDIDIAAGIAIDATNAKFIKLASGITKRLDSGWVVGSGNGGLDTGSIANTTYHIWLIMRSDTGVVDVLFSASASSPTMPSNYDYKRRIGSIVRSGGAIRAFVQVGDEFHWSVQAADVNTSGPGTSAVTATLTVPTGIVVNAKIMLGISDGTPIASRVLVTALSQADTDPSSLNAGTLLWNDGGNNGTDASLVTSVYTNTSGQIRYRSSASAGVTVYISTIGWNDARGRT